MTEEWKEVMRERATAALSREYGDANPRYTLQGCSAEDAARTAVAALEDALELFRRESYHRGYISGQEDAREAVKGAYEEGCTDPEYIIRVAGPPERRKRRNAVPRDSQA